MWIIITGLAINLDNYSSIRKEYSGLFDRWQMIGFETLNGIDKVLLSYATEQEVDMAFYDLEKVLKNDKCRCLGDAS